MPTKTSLFIAVNPVGSKFAKALQQGLSSLAVTSKRVSPLRGAHLQAKGRKVFYVTQNVLDKVQQLALFSKHGVSCPKYCLSAADIPKLEAKNVFARTLINSTGGRGIVEFASGDKAPVAPLYTEYIPKKAEYRLHVFNGKVVDRQQKKRRHVVDEEHRNARVHNLANGYVYSRDIVFMPAGLDQLAINAVAALGYKYGAVDIIYNEKRNQCYVLEVNSRPGLMGTTVETYAKALKESYL
jgi:glutathione synthase/RimK-type ligase-like ATP-grasp enzyme